MTTHTTLITTPPPRSTLFPYTTLFRSKYTRSETPPDNYVQGYTMHHGIAPNGGGTLVNQWTLITDILYPDLHQGDQYSAFIEIQNSTDSDADLAVHEESPGVGGIGISGRYPGNLTQGQWHRVVFAVDMAVTPGVISKFIDGVKAADQTDADGRGLDGRFSLSDVAHLFSDGGHDNEVNTYYVNSVQIREGKMADYDVVALGGPSAAGIPLPKVTGQWDFDKGDLKATVGQDLEYGDGPGGFMTTQTSFDTTTGFGIPNICFFVCNGNQQNLHSFPTRRSSDLYTMHHGIAPNGGGT